MGIKLVCIRAEHIKMIFWSCGGFEKSRLENKRKREDSSRRREVAISLVLLALGGSLLAATAGLLGEKDGLDVRQDTSLGDGNSLQELVEFLVVADGELEMARVDPLLLVVAGGVACQL